MANVHNGLHSDTDRVATDLLGLGEAADQVRLANYGRATPLMAMRTGQMEREIARTRAQYGADAPEVAERTAAFKAVHAEFVSMQAETGRLRVTPPPLDGKTEAGLRGRVVRGAEPVADAQVIIEGGSQILHACTDAAGGFALAVPATIDLKLSVRTKDDGLAYRDTNPIHYPVGAQAERIIDLIRAAPPCDLEDPHNPLTAAGTPAATVAPAETVAPTTTVAAPAKAKVPNVTGMTLAAAAKVLEKARFVLGKAVEKPGPATSVGKILTQTPAANATAPVKSAVAVTVGVRTTTTTKTPTATILRTRSGKP